MRRDTKVSKTMCAVILFAAIISHGVFFLNSISWFRFSFWLSCFKLYDMACRNFYNTLNQITHRIALPALSNVPSKK